MYNTAMIACEKKCYCWEYSLVVIGTLLANSNTHPPDLLSVMQLRTRGKGRLPAETKMFLQRNLAQLNCQWCSYVVIKKNEWT